MKRFTTLLLAAGLVCSAFSAANAADIKAKGMWDFNFEYTNDSFDKHSSGDRFGAAQRLRTQIDVIASESLKGVVYFEIGDTHWGHAKDGASLGTDGRTVEVRYSYIDWAIPETDVLVRMGLQPFVMPGFEIFTLNWPQPSVFSSSVKLPRASSFFFRSKMTFSLGR